MSNADPARQIWRGNRNKGPVDGHVRKPPDKCGSAPYLQSMMMDVDACYRALSTRDCRFDGRLFVAVKTTGIYCRPICPAQTPKRQNVIFYPSAAAAQAAGFRPCLRCRPETSPELAVWRGSSNTVSRALSLIDAGALDDGNVDALALCLGMGDRQLRRLFRSHLGATPIAVAQTRRVLLAKQLLHETRLPMSEVALASGFGSVRRFNEVFQTLFDRPPGALRRLTGEVAADVDGIRLELPYRTPFDWEGLISYLSFRAIKGVEVVSPERYARAIALDGEVGLLMVEPGRKSTLSVTIRFPKLSALHRIIARVRHIFDLTADPEAITEHLSRDPALAPRVAARPGLRVPGAWDGFELTVRAILGQQITVVAATRLAAHIVTEWGEPLPATLRNIVPGITHTFPNAERLAAADLSKLSMPRARSATLEALAKAVVLNPKLLEPAGDLDEAVTELRRLRGIGEWTAEYIAMRQLRSPDGFPASDIGLLRAMVDAAGTRPAPAALKARAEAWRPWRAYAALHLWSGELIPDPLAQHSISEDHDAREAV